MFPPDTRILVVDDMVGMRKLVKEQLMKMGFKSIKEAENGEAGLAELNAALARGEPYGLVLSDWNMPVLQGIELLRRVRADAKFANLPFMLITAEGEFNQVKEAITLKVSEYIVKPFTPATIKAKLETVWKKHNK
jgi:two-component system chemotaxis response regulator CheY